jgi:hypothetical protein
MRVHEFARLLGGKGARSVPGLHRLHNFAHVQIGAREQPRDLLVRWDMQVAAITEWLTHDPVVFL